MKSSSLGERRRWVLSVLQQHEVPLLRFAVRLLGDEDAARDVVQFVFLRLCEQSPEQLRDRVAPWLFRVCRNKAIDVLRGRRRTEPLDDSRQALCDDRQPDPAEEVENRELHGRLGDLIDRLPQGQREAIALWSEGFSYREIAQMTDRSEGNVRVLAHRAIKRLRESVGWVEQRDPHPSKQQQ